ncbi:MAG: Asp-tRNA(Asn)/Glu-tRNA(Gln) amidotransferase subunit GatA, partial [Rhizobiaceae bacterium]|nr:Asp-tRNA(Asn)/Glu-tRNA(Gln) amidotransferase subunit GatA [Rhizobiaceae bacterium]
MTELTSLTLAEAREKLTAKEITSVELTQSYLDAIASANDELNAYIVTTGEQALAQAKKSDERLAKGKGGALEGLPLGIKDLFATKGVHTQA